MDKIVCGAKRCFHNMAGACFADVVFVDEHIDECGSAPYCRSFEGVTPSIYAGTDRRVVFPGDVCCSKINCIYNKGRICESPVINISGPERGSLCWCLNYNGR